MFIDPNEEIEVGPDARGNRIWIKAKLDFGDQAKIEASLIQLKLKSKQGKNSVRPNDPDQGMEVDATVTYSARQRAVLEVCIKRWAGPDFEGIPCTKDKIRLLDPNEPLIVDVLETIDEMNKPPAEIAPLESEPINPNPTTPNDLGE